MLGIYIAALLTTAAALGIFGVVIHKLRLPAKERLLWLAALIALPLQPLVFYLVRVPLDHWLAAHLDHASALYRWLVTFYAPLTEEPAKLVPLLVPAIRRDISPNNFVRYALAIGMGFAIGEMWFIAERVTHDPSLAALPFYQFGGFFQERLMVCAFHSAFVSVALWRFRRRFVLGILGAMALHWFGNFPIALKVWNAWNLGGVFWMNFIQLFLLAYFIGAIVLLGFFVFRCAGPNARGVIKFFYGPRHCPECGKDYEAPIFGLNFGRTRYERCPHCKKWHWTGAG